VPAVNDFNGKVVVVTGRRLGHRPVERAPVRAAGREGARDRHRRRFGGGRARGDRPGRGRPHGRLERSGGGRGAGAARLDEDGAVDVLHNNAGIGHAADIEETTVEDCSA